MKKIGILTMTYGCNFGGTLQSIGLFKTLKKLQPNQEIEVLNYIPHNSYSFLKKNISGSGINSNIKKSIKNIFFSPKETLLKIFIKIKNVDKSIKKFNKFREKELVITEVLSEKSIEVKSKEYSHLIVGSDQVWNVINGVREVYFLGGIKNLIKISYAVCSGRDFYKKEDENNLKVLIKDFNYISVRNTHTYNFTKRLVEKDSEIVCDPSILYDYKEYLTQKSTEEKYILTYILGSEIDGGHQRVLNNIKRKVGNIKIIAIGIAYSESGSLQFYPWADKVIYDASPEDWLNLINNAEFIYTDSYHGVLFSMKFHKKFLAYYSEKARASRFIDLGERYEVQDWIINTIEELKIKNSLEKEIDYIKIDKLLNEHREYSMNFLKKALGESNE